MRKAIISVLVALVAATALVAVPTAAHAVGCWNQGCDGRDPEAMGCSADAINLDSVTIPGFHSPTATLRYSPACGAAWGRTTRSTVYLRVERQTPNRIETRAPNNYCLCTVWTGMVGARNAWTQICTYSQAHNPPWYCGWWNGIA